MTIMIASLRNERTNETEPTEERMRANDDADENEERVWGSGLTRPKVQRAGVLTAFSRMLWEERKDKTSSLMGKTRRAVAYLLLAHSVLSTY